MLARACHTKDGSRCERFISKPAPRIAYVTGCPYVSVSRRANVRTLVGFCILLSGGDLSTIALCSMKGGTGKTTLAVNLAERAHASGLRVAVIDFDPQEGAIGLLDLRADQESAWPVFASRVNVAGAKSLASMKSGGEYDLFVCDLPGSDSMALGRLLMEMDLILSPVGDSAVEIMVAANFTSMVERIDLPVVFVPNNIIRGTGAQ